MENKLFRNPNKHKAVKEKNKWMCWTNRVGSPRRTSSLPSDDLWTLSWNMIHHTLKLILQINFSKVNRDVYEQPEDINCQSDAP